MILVYEPFLTDYEHVFFNAAILDIISKRYCSEKIMFYADENHIKYIRELGIFNNVEFCSMKVVIADHKFKALIQEIRNEKILSKKCKNESDIVFVLNSHPHTMYLVKKYFGKKRINFIVHGSLEELQNKKHFWQLGYYIKPAFKYRNWECYKYIVLGESIRKNTLKYIPNIDAQLVSIPLPIEGGMTKKCSVDQKKTFKIGTIGTGSRYKRSDLLFKVDKELNKRNVNNIELYHIGTYLDINVPELSNVKVIGGKKNKLSSEEYSAKLQELDYILFFFDKDSYKLTASGALTDAIRYMKPVFSIRNDYFEGVVDEVGQIAVLFDDENQMIDYLEQLAKGNILISKDKMQSTFLYAQEYFSKDNISREMEMKHIFE